MKFFHKLVLLALLSAVIWTQDQPTPPADQNPPATDQNATANQTAPTTENQTQPVQVVAEKFISVDGVGAVFVPPDTIIIAVTLNRTASNAADALNYLSTDAQAFVNNLTQNGVSANDTSVTYFNLYLSNITIPQQVVAIAQEVVPTMPPVVTPAPGQPLQQAAPDQNATTADQTANQTDNATAGNETAGNATTGGQTTGNETQNQTTTGNESQAQNQVQQVWVAVQTIQFKIPNIALDATANNSNFQQLAQSWNNIQNATVQVVGFDAANKAQALTQARQQALQDAQNKVNEYATQANTTVTGLRNIVSNENYNGYQVIVNIVASFFIQ